MPQYLSPNPNVEQPVVAAPAALTSAASAAAPTKVEFDKTVADLVALRTTVAALRTALVALGHIA